MEFRFETDTLFRTPIVLITNTLLPSGYMGDRRSALDATARVSEILNTVGEASARAQGLTKAVTTAEKLRNSDHTVYLLAEKIQNKKPIVTGLLKIGQKSLYIFDENGDTQMIKAPCLLDFYVHESRQRAGLGKILFETMLQNENLSPQQLAIDRPSEKLIGFMRKHYGLTTTIPQMNNFVIYTGFFKNKSQNKECTINGQRVTSSPNTSLFGPQSIGDKRRSRSQGAMHQFSIIPSSTVGRYAAPRPHCSMAQIIHNCPTQTVPTEPQRDY